MFPALSTAASARAAIASVLLVVATAVYGQPARFEGNSSELPSQPAAAQTDDAGPPLNGRTTPAPAAAPPGPIWTKYAYFVPSRFDDLPGWDEDHLADAWSALRASCNVLSSRTPWASTCARLRALRVHSDDDVRRFLEQEFVLYQIHNKDRSVSGVITGYYEPLLRGSRRYGGRYIYPVYAVPDDLIYLDSRSIPQVFPGGRIFVRVYDRTVIPICTTFLANASCDGPYVLEIGDAKPDIRDKKLRVRVDGNRVVPYYTRAEINQGALATGRVIVWVDDAAALYSMQVQGSGKIQLTDGETVRVVYAEQNGHPFIPPVMAVGRNGKETGTPLLTRGLVIPSGADNRAAGDSTAADDSAVMAPRGGQVGQSAQRSESGDRANTTDEDLSPEVAHMVELLLHGNTAPEPVAHVAPKVAQSGGQPISQPAPAGARPPVTQAVALPDPGALSRFSNDPSYVFFRQIPDSDQGPPGALGVPLTAGRSVAVDPRTTPLGFPVFVSTEGQSLGSQLNRLMLAQDTGGAIRGPVRADYFWGFGQKAGELASHMKENGRMWLLVPKDLQLGSGASLATRGLGGADGGDAECLVPDPELCVE